MITIKLNARKTISFLLMSAILVASWFFVCGETIVLLGLIAIFIQIFANLRFVGWVSAVSYSLTYCIAALFDNPIYPEVPNNLYLIWYLGYGLIFAVALILDFILKYRNQIR